MDLLITLVPLAAVVALLAAFLLARNVMAAPTGDARMVEISDAVRQGAGAYMNRQYRTITIVAVIITAMNETLSSESSPRKGASSRLPSTATFLINGFCRSMEKTLAPSQNNMAA